MFKKALNTFALAALLVGTASQAKSILLEYQFGNQIISSHLSVFDDGSADLAEGTNWKPETKKSYRLKPILLKGLKAFIAKVDPKNVKTYKGGSTTMGSQSGDLTVYPEAGKSLLIRNVQRASMDVVGSNDLDIRNLSPQALKIEEWALSQVKYKMHPRLTTDVPCQDKLKK